MPYLDKPFNVSKESFDAIFGSAKLMYIASVSAYLVTYTCFPSLSHPPLDPYSASWFILLLSHPFFSLSLPSPPGGFSIRYLAIWSYQKGHQRKAPMAACHRQYRHFPNPGLLCRVLCSVFIRQKFDRTNSCYTRRGIKILGGFATSYFISLTHPLYLLTTPIHPICR